MTDTSDEFQKVLEGGSTSDADNASEQKVGKESTSVTPPSSTTIKVGDRELSTEDLERKLKIADEVESLEKEQNISVRELKADYTKKAMELAQLRKKVEPIEQAFDKSRETPTEELPADYDTVRSNARKYKLLTEDEVKPISERLQKLEEKLSDREKSELRDDLNAELDGLKKTHEFIKRDELLDYMIKKADAGTNLSPEEAARLLYSDQFALIRAKELGYATPNLPQTDANGRSNGDQPAATKKLDFDGGGISDALEESLNTNPVQ
jgi:uncharacterized protein YPO0396